MEKADERVHGGGGDGEGEVVESGGACGTVGTARVRGQAAFELGALLWHVMCGARPYADMSVDDARIERAEVVTERAGAPMACVLRWLCAARAGERASLVEGVRGVMETARLIASAYDSERVVEGVSDVPQYVVKTHAKEKEAWEVQAHDDEADWAAAWAAEKAALQAEMHRLERQVAEERERHVREEAALRAAAAAAAAGRAREVNARVVVRAAGRTGGVVEGGRVEVVTAEGLEHRDRVSGNVVVEAGRRWA